MGSPDRLFNRQRSVHQILGGGLVADVILWRNKNLTAGILVVTLAAWLVFEISGYTLVSLVSSVFLLLVTILFLWAKSAAIINSSFYISRILALSLFWSIVIGIDINIARPPPPLPHLHLSDEMVQEAAAITGKYINRLLSLFQDIALGKDSRMFANVAMCLLLLSIVGGLIDLASLIYMSLLIVLSIPVLYEKYEDHLDRYSLTTIDKLKILYNHIDRECMSVVQGWNIEKKKLS